VLGSQPSLPERRPRVWSIAPPNRRRECVELFGPPCRFIAHADLTGDSPITTAAASLPPHRGASDRLGTPPLAHPSSSSPFASGRSVSEVLRAIWGPSWRGTHHRNLAYLAKVLLPSRNCCPDPSSKLLQISGLDSNSKKCPFLTNI